MSQTYNEHQESEDKNDTKWLFRLLISALVLGGSTFIGWTSVSISDLYAKNAATSEIVASTSKDRDTYSAIIAKNTEAITLLRIQIARLEEVLKKDE